MKINKIKIEKVYKWQISLNPIKSMQMSHFLHFYFSQMIYQKFIFRFINSILKNYLYIYIYKDNLGNKQWETISTNILLLFINYYDYYYNNNY